MASNKIEWCHPKLRTLPGTNMEVENGPLEDHIPLQTGGFPLPSEFSGVWISHHI